MPTAEPNTDRKPCKVCGEPIADSAKKCIHCESYQDWRSFFGVSATVLSLLVALIAVSTPFVGSVRGLFHKPKAELQFSIQGATHGVLSVMVANDGDRAGTVGDAILDLPDTESILLTLQTNAVTELIPAGSTALLNYRVNEFPKRLPNASASCSIDFIATPNRVAQREYGYVSYPFKCSYLARVFPGWVPDLETGEPRLLEPIKSMIEQQANKSSAK